MAADRKEATRRNYLETLEKYRRDFEAPGSDEYWSPSLDCASRDELRAIQDAKLKDAVPFLYENSDFYRRRFDGLGLIPDDIRNIDDLVKFPPVDKKEMVEDLMRHQPWGTYTTHDDAVWDDRGWSIFATSGTTGLPRAFRYSRIDLDYWRWANARALHSFPIRKGDSVFLVAGFGPHVWAWGVYQGLTHMGVPCIVGGGMDSTLRANIILRYRPTVLAALPSYLLRLGRVMQEMGENPAETSVKTIFTAGEPAAGIDATRERLEEMWGARLVEFYGCTEASPHSGGYSCAHNAEAGFRYMTHLMEDIQYWELIDPDSKARLPVGERGVTVCTNLNSESSTQLRFIVGDYTTLTDEVCACGRTHARAVGGFQGRADDLINLRGLKFYPSVIEDGVRAVPGVGDEYEVVIETNKDGLDVMTVRVEHPEHASPAAVIDRVKTEITSRIEARCDVEVLPPDTFPKTEMKAKRISDTRNKG